ncbi:agamous-like MADS-box protein AGL62 [Cornus florida]|uniref:agamous-like MADS-box protein AGL62 n=1 Tax=Cornus florida TaxID=4283 RepID=UPI00289B84C6|nr:agamous-like MADS-box protein AGL62 [Cornus florida]
MKKTTQGRKKIEIEKTEQVNNRQVTISKRRAGLFKKAGELCTFSGAEAAVSSPPPPGGHAFSSRHESVVHDAVMVDKHVCGSSSLPSMQYDQISKGIEAEKRRSVMNEEGNRVGGGLWWDPPVDDDMSDDRVEQYMTALTTLDELKKKLDIKANEITMMKASYTNAINHHIEIIKLCTIVIIGLVIVLILVVGSFVRCF